MVFIKMKIILQFYCENTTDAQQKDRRQLQVFRPGFHSTDQDFGMKSSSYFAIAKRSDMALI